MDDHQGSKARGAASAQLLAFQENNRRATVAKLEAALEALENEIAAGKLNNGRLTRKEICRRAGVGESTLKNPSHRSTRTMVDKWLVDHGETRGKKKASKEEEASLVGGNASVEKAVAALANQLNLAKVEIEEMGKELRAARQRVAELEAMRFNRR